VIAEPLLITGATQERSTSPEAPHRTAIRPVGAFGTEAGVTVLLGSDSILVPTILVAVTEKVYCVPLVRPVMVTLPGIAVVTKCHSFDIMVYKVIADQPLLAGAVNVMVACPGVVLMALVIIGLAGVVAGVTVLLCIEAALSPRALVAVTVKV